MPKIKFSSKPKTSQFKTHFKVVVIVFILWVVILYLDVQLLFFDPYWSNKYIKFVANVSSIALDASNNPMMTFWATTQFLKNW
jgi:hypothetical protein